MTKYLDQNGLAYFWTKIKAWLSSHAPVKYFGQNWVEDTNNDYALVVGNGADGNNPKDVFMIEHDGDLVIGGEDFSNSISFRGENTTETMIEFESNSDNNDGNGLALGAVGRMVIGSGGAKDWFLNQFLAGQSPDDPRLYLGTAHNAHLFTNYDDPNNTGHFEFSEAGNFIIYNSGVIKQYSKFSGSAHLQAGQLLNGLYRYDSNNDLIGYDEIHRKDVNAASGEGLYRSFIVKNPVSGTTYGLYFDANDDGTIAVGVAGGASGQKAFRDGIGADNGIWPISLGGSGMANYQYFSNASDVLTPESGITMTSVSTAKWGKVVCIRVEWKKNSAISIGANGDMGDMLIATLKDGFRPVQWIMSVSGQNNRELQGHYTLTSDGYIKLTGGFGTGSARTIAANTTMQMSVCYVAL